MKKSKLSQNEYGHFYATYLNTLGDEDLMESFQDGRDWFVNFIKNLDAEKLHYRYAEGKWTIAEVLVHIIDTERIFQYRAFRFSRNDMTALPGFEQDGYIVESECLKRTKEQILEEYLTVRNATISLFDGMSSKKLKRVGTASDMPWSVAALGFVISGHQKHHGNILTERYI